MQLRITSLFSSLTLGAVLAFAGPMVSIARAEIPAVKKVAMVDLQRVLNETTAGKKARKDLETSSKSKQEKLDKKRAKLESDAAKLKDLSGQNLAQAQEKLQKESVELQSMLYTLQQELAEQEGKLLDTIYRNTQDIVGKLAKEQALDLVLVRDQMTVIYTVDGLDITAEVIKHYDKKHPT